MLAQTAATNSATTATTGFNTALLANPITLTIVAVVALVAALVALQMKFDILNKALETTESIFKGITEVVNDTINAFGNVTSKLDIASTIMKASPIGMAMELTGGIR